MTDQLDHSPIISEVFGDAAGKMELFHKKLEDEGLIRGLIGPRDGDIIWERHILNSAALVPFIKEMLPDPETDRQVTIGDVGTGGGFPGIVLASCFPAVSFDLIEPMERRCEWLAEMVDMLQLTNATVVRARTEELISKKKEFSRTSGGHVDSSRANAGRRGRKPGSRQAQSEHFNGYDIVTCRAVAPMTKLAGMTLPLLKKSGRLIALKGKSAAAELEKARKELKKNGAVSTRVCQAPVAPQLEPTHVVIVQVR